jgi:hypothetical protein
VKLTTAGRTVCVAGIIATMVGWANVFVWLLDSNVSLIVYANLFVLISGVSVLFSAFCLKRLAL